MLVLSFNSILFSTYVIAKYSLKILELERFLKYQWIFPKKYLLFQIFFWTFGCNLSTFFYNLMLFT